MGLIYIVDLQHSHLQPWTKQSLNSCAPSLCHLHWLVLYSFSALVCLHLVSVWRAGQNDNKWILGDFSAVQIRGEEKLSMHWHSGGEGRAVAGLEGEVSRGRRWCEGLDGPKQLRTIWFILKHQSKKSHLIKPQFSKSVKLDIKSSCAFFLIFVCTEELHIQWTWVSVQLDNQCGTPPQSFVNRDFLAVHWSPFLNF